MQAVLITAGLLSLPGALVKVVTILLGAAEEGGSDGPPVDLRAMIGPTLPGAWGKRERILI